MGIVTHGATQNNQIGPTRICGTQKRTLRPVATRDRRQFFIFSFVSSSDPLFEYPTLGFLVLWIIIFIFSATYCISIIKTQLLLLLCLCSRCCVYALYSYSYCCFHLYSFSSNNKFTATQRSDNLLFCPSEFAEGMCGTYSFCHIFKHSHCIGYATFQPLKSSFENSMQLKSS
ncbi:hypothetical protein HanHA300_Chr16g0604971 [Helianthus annuus]|nr:hypothetical protein HanHA300_Chr16g0604971 [Helianthus annuus]KAJ0459996.1 hypothetical protein HanHA89_Chr16g0655501 [Helianthus annuus]KAJ0644402.1 hypothetical protein HanOQP8_Chr16g0611701 [Helianthus annuus]